MMTGLHVFFEMTSRDYTFPGPEKLFKSSFLAHFLICLNRFKYKIVPEIFQKPKASCVNCYSFHFIVHTTLQATVADARLESKIFLKRDLREIKQLKMPFLLFLIVSYHQNIPAILQKLCGLCYKRKGIF